MKISERQGEPNALHVRMFGGFQLFYCDRPLTREKQRESYFTGLMQILLHHAATGVSRDYLENALLEDRDVENRHQALQTIVYKAKKRLKGMGLPDENYIFSKNGVYYWTSRIPVVEDAALFDECCKRAVSCPDEEERLNLYLDACYQYRGEFLSAYAAVLWAGAEARRYRTEFCRCAENAAAILREKGDWMRLEELGRHAVKAAPFSDWECLVMEALSGLGRYDEAVKLYDATVENYLNEQGTYPSAKFMEAMDKLGNRMEYSYAALEQIKQRLQEDKGDTFGGYRCSYPIFQGIYRTAARMAERGGQSVYLMMCRLTDGRGNPMKRGKRLEELSAELGEAIRTSVRHGDIINFYGNGQYLVLLINITREDCSLVENRIDRKFLTGRRRVSLQYYVSSVLCKSDYG